MVCAMERLQLKDPKIVNMSSTAFDVEEVIHKYQQSIYDARPDEGRARQVNSGPNGTISFLLARPPCIKSYLSYSL